MKLKDTLASMTDNIISPLNYMGGKKKLLKKISPYFPSNVDTFYDVFCGGATVGINAECRKVHFNDIIYQLIQLYHEFKNTDINDILSFVDNRIKEYDLSMTNADGYLSLRKYYNEHRNPLDLFVLTAYSFNNQIRFNSKGEFNMPFGKNRSWFNPVMRKNLIGFVAALQKKEISFSSLDFESFDFSQIKENDFVYMDPPYLISVATYNMIWDENKERSLLKELSKLNERGIKFALSNVLENKGETNTILKEWAETNNFNIIHLDYSYANSSYHRKERTTSDEVLITNYKNEDLIF